MTIKENLYTLYLNGKRRRVLMVSDVHLRAEEFKQTTIYVPTQENVILRIIKAAEEGMFDVVIFLGDLFDGPYKDVSKALYHIILFEKLNKALNGHVYKVIGNHPLNNKRNYVVTFFLTGMIKSLRAGFNNINIQRTLDGWVSNIGLEEPLIKVPDRLVINGAVFNFFHFNKEDKEYYDPLIDITPTVHLGLYHDNILTHEVNKYVSELANGGKFMLPSIKIDKDSLMLSNVDYATFGDIHTKIGEFEIYNEFYDHKVIVDVPGSLGRTANHTAQHHNDINLPLFTVEEDGSVIKQHLNFPLVDYRDIFNIKVQEEQKAKAKRMKDFKETLDEFAMHKTFEHYLESSNDATDDVKQLLTTIIKDKQSLPEYTKSELYQEFLKPYI